MARWSLADGADADGMTQLLQSWAFLPAAVAFFSVLAHTGMWNTARILEDPFVHYFLFRCVFSFFYRPASSRTRSSTRQTTSPRSRCSGRSTREL